MHDADLREEVRQALAAAGDPARASAMQKYMKPQLPYHGVRLPDVRRICGPLFAARPIASAQAFDETVERLFADATRREERYAAMQLAKHRLYRELQTPDRVALYRGLIVTGAWWDTVDEREDVLSGLSKREARKHL